MNKKNLIYGRALRIFALVVAIALIFGSMAVFYAESEGGTPVESDSDAASPSDVTTSPSDVTATSPSDVTTSPSDVTTTSPSDVTTSPSDVTTTSPSDVTTSPSDVTTTSPSDVVTSSSDVTTASTAAPGKLAALDCIPMSETVSLAEIDSLGSGGAMIIDIGASIFLFDAEGHAISSLADACEDGAKVDLTGAYTHQLSDGAKVELWQLEGEPVFYIYQSCLVGGEVGDELKVVLPITVTDKNGDKASAEFEFFLRVTDAGRSTDSTSENTTAPSDAEETSSDTDKSTAATTKTTAKTTAATTKGGGSPNTGDITVNNTSGLNTAGGLMLLSGLVILVTLAADRMHRDSMQRRDRANAVRR